MKAPAVWDFFSLHSSAQKVLGLIPDPGRLQFARSVLEQSSQPPNCQVERASERACETQAGSLDEGADGDLARWPPPPCTETCERARRRDMKQSWEGNPLI